MKCVNGSGACFWLHFIYINYSERDLPLSFALSYGYRFVSDTFYTRSKQNSTICCRCERERARAHLFICVLFSSLLRSLCMTHDVFVQNTLSHDIEINVREKPVAEIHITNTCTHTKTLRYTSKSYEENVCFWNEFCGRNIDALKRRPQRRRRMEAE